MGSRINPGSETAGCSLIISSLFWNSHPSLFISKKSCFYLAAFESNMLLWYTRLLANAIIHNMSYRPGLWEQPKGYKGGNSQQMNFGNHPRSTLSSPRRQFCCRKDKAGCYAHIKLIPQLFFTNGCIWSLKITTVNENSWFIRGVGFWIFHASSFVFLLFSVILATILFSR